jgi:adenylate kinase
MIIAVSGTPCTGKTTLAQALAKRLGYQYVDVKQIIEDRHLSLGYDRKRKCLVVDPKKVNKTLMELIAEKGDAVIDSHLSHYLPPTFVDRCIITTCGLKELEKRLKRRKYHASKIRENLDSEIFEVCRSEAIEMGHKVVVLDTSKPYDLGRLIKKLGAKETK